LKANEKTSKQNTSMPSENKNCSFVLTPNKLEYSKRLLIKMLFSMRSGLVKTAINGIIDATPIASNKAINKIIINK